MILKHILQSIFVKHQKYYDNVSNNFNIEFIKKDLKSMDKTLIEFLFNEVLFVYFFTLDINNFKLIDFNKFEQELEHINEEVNIYDFHILTNLLSDKDFCKSCAILYNNYHIIDMNKIMKTVQNLKDINTSFLKTKNNSSLIKNMFIYKSYKTILKNIEFNCDISSLKEKKYSLFVKENNSVFYKSIEVKKNIENIKQKNLNKKVKINILKVYFNFPFLEKILPLSKDSNIIDLDFFCDRLLDIIFIDNIYYDEFINSINYIFSEIDKPFNFFSFTEDLTISINDLDIILEEDLNFFIQNILSKKYKNKNNENYFYTFNNRFGINGCNLQTFQEIADTLNLKRQRIEQIQKTIIAEYNRYSKISSNSLIVIVHELISKCHNLNTCFKLLRKHFSKDEDFYFYIETICNQSLNHIKNLVSPNIDMRIFDEYSLINKMPFSYDEIYNIIEENSLIDKKFVKYTINYLTQNGKIDVNVTNEPLYTPLALSIPTMYSQILLSYPNGQEMNATLLEIDSVFKIKTTRQNMDMDRYKNVYLYGKNTYRHTNFFDLIYKETETSNTLQQIYNFLSTSNSDKNIHQCIQHLKSHNNNITYYDLRYMLKKYGAEFTPPILLAGKSNADIVSLIQPKGKSLKTIIIDFVNKSKDPFQIEELYKKITMQHNTVDTTFFNLLKEGKSLCRVDGLHYSKPTLAFSNNNPHIENLLISKINGLFNVNPKISITIAYLEYFLNKNLHLTYHKFWYLSFIRFHKDKFKNIYEFESNVLNITNNNQSLTTIIKNLLIEFNYDKLLVEEKIKDIVLCTATEMKATISSVISKEKINIINKDNHG